MNKVLKRLNESVINEGSWGTHPLQSDGTLDFTDDLFGEITDFVLDRCRKQLRYNTGDNAYNVIGCIQDFLATYNHPYLSDKVKDEFRKIYTKAIEICDNDEEWKSDWNDNVKEDVQNRIDNEFMEVFDNLIDNNNFSQEVRAIKDNWLRKK